MQSAKPLDSTLQLNNEGGTELHWTEYGVGGGTCQGGNCPAKTAADAAYYPFYGVFGEYRADNDPWKLQETKVSPAREYLWYFYNTTAQHLTTQVLNHTFEFPCTLNSNSASYSPSYT